MKIKTMLLCSLFAALSAILSQAAVPVGPVPVTLTHVSVFMAAGLLGARRGALSQIVYVVLGAAGAPVFAGMTGGIAKISGPTGGFIIGYIACAFVSGFIMEKAPKEKSRGALIPALAMSVGMIFTYAPGVLWFMGVTGAAAAAALSACVLPFLPGDALKIALCIFLLNRVKINN